MPWWVRAALAATLAVAGFAVGCASVLVHQGSWGLALAIAAPAATAYALPGGWSTRFAFAVGWVGALTMFYLRRPEGDYLLSADAHGYAVLGFGLVLTSFSVATLRPLRPAPSPPSSVPSSVPSTPPSDPPSAVPAETGRDS